MSLTAPRLARSARQRAFNALLAAVTLPALACSDVTMSEPGSEQPEDSLNPLSAQAQEAGLRPPIATFVKTSDWGTGFVAEYRIYNGTDSTLRGWSLQFNLPSNINITSAWNGQLESQGGQVTITPVPWTEAIPPDATVTIGFEGTYSGVWSDPSNCLLNDQLCAGGGEDSDPPDDGDDGAPGDGSDAGDGTSGRDEFSPYLDVLLSPPPDLDALAVEAGVTHFNLAFIVNGASQCKAAWGGVIPLSENFMSEEIRDLRSTGGDVRISFGGANGVELAESCSSVDSLVAQYAAVVDLYGLTKVDFDIEGGAIADPVSIERRSQAIAELQRRAQEAGRALDVSLTLPVLPQGLTADGLQVLMSAIASGVRIDGVNIMAMDYGDAVAPDPDGRMGKFAIEAATNTQEQLAELYPNRSTAELWAMVEVTVMIGQNDVQSEVFRQQDALELLEFAGQIQFGSLSMWSMTRDVECPEGITPWASPTCSGILQEPFEFSGILGSYSN
ncbi:MAG: sugar hydrolase [Gemmatimonas sp.]|nr:sugar hydrolase [Gemmatimonas sp.]